ncbi:hypothetical protein Hdeb2414_s0819g00950341 [Helianthus debilis subsp. tardiflorus]
MVGCRQTLPLSLGIERLLKRTHLLGNLAQRVTRRIDGVGKTDNTDSGR